MDSTLADFILEDNWESELNSLFPQNNEVFLLFNQEPTFSFDSSIVSSSNVEYFENQSSVFSPIPIQQQTDSSTSSITLNNVDLHSELISSNENVAEQCLLSNSNNSLMNPLLVGETMTPLFEEQLQSTIAAIIEQPFANLMFAAQPNPQPPQQEETKKKRKEISSSNEFYDQSKKRKKDNTFAMNHSITVSSAGVSSSVSSSNSNTPTTPTGSNSKKKSNAKRKGWLENICSSIDKPPEELVLPPVVGNGGKKTLRFHTVNFK